MKEASMLYVCIYVLCELQVVVLARSFYHLNSCSLAMEDSNDCCIVDTNKIFLLNVLTHLIADSFHSNITSKTNLGIYASYAVSRCGAFSNE